MNILPLEDFKGSQTIRYGTAATSASANKAPIFIKQELNQLYNYVKMKFSEAPFDWDARKTYDIGEVCGLNNKVYKAIEVNANQEPPTSAWTEVNTDSLNLELKYVQIQSNKYISLENRNNHRLMSVRDSSLGENDAGNSLASIMTPKNGLVPYDNGSSSYLGTSSLKFKEANIVNGKFSEIHSTTGNITTLTATNVTASTFHGTATNADKLDGHDSASSSTGNTIVLRTSTGGANFKDIHGTTINGTSGNIPTFGSTNVTVSNKTKTKTLEATDNITAPSASITTITATNVTASTFHGTATNADKLDGHDSSNGTTANTVVVRKSNGKIAGTVDNADKLSGKTLSSAASASVVVQRLSNGKISGTIANADKLSNKSLSGTATANTVVQRDGSADITARLFRSTYATQPSLASSADICFRNNTTDDYLRFVTHAGMINWIGEVNDSAKLGSVAASQYMRKDITQNITGTVNLTGDNQFKLTLNNTVNHKSSEIHFNSYANKNSDFGYIRYDDDNNSYNKWGDSAENSALVIGVANDGQASVSDIVALESPAGIFLNAPDVYVGNKSTLHNMHAQTFYGNSTSASYADLAENYSTDVEYEPGTVLGFGGENEVTLYNGSMKLAGVVSTAPGYLLNSETNGVSIALKGRVPCNIIGDAKRGQYIIADADGFGKAVDDYTFEESKKLLGIAISDSKNSIVEIKV